LVLNGLRFVIKEGGGSGLEKGIVFKGTKLLARKGVIQRKKRMMGERNGSFREMLK